MDGDNNNSDDNSRVGIKFLKIMSMEMKGTLKINKTYFDQGLNRKDQ